MQEHELGAWSEPWAAPASSLPFPGAAEGQGHSPAPKPRTAWPGPLPTSPTPAQGKQEKREAAPAPLPVQEPLPCPLPYILLKLTQAPSHGRFPVKSPLPGPLLSVPAQQTCLAPQGLAVPCATPSSVCKSPFGTARPLSWLRPSAARAPGHIPAPAPHHEGSLTRLTATHSLPFQLSHPQITRPSLRISEAPGPHVSSSTSHRFHRGPAPPVPARAQPCPSRAVSILL